MNNILGKIANNKKLAFGIMAAGFMLSALGNAIAYIGVYYAGIKKGVDAHIVEE